MSLEFALAIGFGLGISGLVTRAFDSSEATLANRVSRKPLSSHPLKTRSFKSLANSFSRQFRSSNSSKLEKVLFELPEIIYLLTVSLRSGEGIYRSFATVVPRCDGDLGRELARVLRAVEFGAAFGEEIKKLSELLPHPQVSEFVSKVSVSLERGTPLAQMLSEQGMSVREEIKSRLLRQAGRNETRMLIPLVFLILPITVLFAVYPSLELLNFGFI